MDSLDSLRHLIQTHPLIDNHAHNILTRRAAANSTQYPLELLTSEAHGAALPASRSALPTLRAVNHLATLYACPADWTHIHTARQTHLSTDTDYIALLRRCLHGTHALLLDDLLVTDARAADLLPYTDHDVFTAAPTKRLVRIEALAAAVLAAVVRAAPPPAPCDKNPLRELFEDFAQEFTAALRDAIADPAVVGFKSVVAYRSGLDVQAVDTVGPPETCALHLLLSFARTIGYTGPGVPPEPSSPSSSTNPNRNPNSTSSSTEDETPYRIADKPFNDWLVRQTLALLSSSPSLPRKPLQFHTGLGDNDLQISLANPALLQPLLAAFPSVPVVLLHSAWPFTREASYLAAVYANVFLDLGAVFPLISREGQEGVLRAALEIAPLEKLVWSTDGHFLAEGFWLANVQGRGGLEKVLVDYVRQGDLTVAQAKSAAADILFHNSNRLYGLGLKVDFEDVDGDGDVAGGTDATDATASRNFVPA